MKNKIFKGISKAGDFNEALSNAIRDAKEELESDYVKWEISKISGSDGGAVVLNIIEVFISITSTTDLTTR